MARCQSCGQEKKHLIPSWIRVPVAWAMFVGGMVGWVLAMTGMLWTSEPYATLNLSWAALAFAGFIALETA